MGKSDLQKVEANVTVTVDWWIIGGLKKCYSKPCKDRST